MQEGTESRGSPAAHVHPMSAETAFSRTTLAEGLEPTRGPPLCCSHSCSCQWHCQWHQHAIGTCKEVTSQPGVPVAKGGPCRLPLTPTTSPLPLPLGYPYPLSTLTSPSCPLSTSTEVCQTCTPAAVAAHLHLHLHSAVDTASGRAATCTSGLSLFFSSSGPRASRSLSAQLSSRRCCYCRRCFCCCYCCCRHCRRCRPHASLTTHGPPSPAPPQAACCLARAPARGLTLPRLTTVLPRLLLRTFTHQ